MTISFTHMIHTFCDKTHFLLTEKTDGKCSQKTRIFHLCSSTNIWFLTEHTGMRNDVILTDASDSAIITSAINSEDEVVWLVCGISLTCIRNDNIAWRFLKKAWNQEITTTFCKTGTMQMTDSSFKHTYKCTIYRHSINSMQKFQSRVEKPAVHTLQINGKWVGGTTDSQWGQYSCTWEFLTHSKQLLHDYLHASFTGVYQLLSSRQ
jgi:hypothetical protein